MRFEQPAPDIHRTRSYLGPIRWVGTPFALAALMPLAGAAGLIEVKIEGTDDLAPPLALLVFALPFLGIGLGLMFFRREVVVDVRAGTVTRKAGVFGIGTSKVRPLDRFDAAVHDKRVIATQKGSRTVFPVSLQTEGGGEFELTNCRDARSARQTAEWIARLGGLAIIDRTDGTDRRREFEDLDTSLRERRERSGEREDPGQPPARMRSKLTARDGEITIEIPAIGMQPLVIVALLVATLPLWMAMVFLTVIAGEDTTPAVFTYAVYGIACIPTLLMTGAILFHARRAFTVSATNDELRVHERGLRRRLVVLPADEIEELSQADDASRKGIDLYTFVGGGQAITVTTDAQQVSFGQSLPPKETAYLTRLLRGTVSA
ncbi:MAG: hypothetical protein KAI24_19925 [Planctomycetes bacterium]|nr:hypothetical protein [Planctomycetota bacterium]